MNLRDDRGRPLPTDGPDVGTLTTNAATVPLTDDVPQQLRRRYDAALRLPPLNGSVRDALLARRPRLSVASARAAYFHLEACGLLSELVVDVLRREVA